MPDTSGPASSTRRRWVLATAIVLGFFASVLIGRLLADGPGVVAAALRAVTPPGE